MKLSVLLVYLLVQSASGTTSPAIRRPDCIEKKMLPVEVTVEETQLDYIDSRTEMGTKWAIIPWPTVHNRPVYKTVPRKTTEMKVHEVAACCPGYYQMGEDCHPHCSHGCNGNGACVGPDSCECFAGWQGDECQETCANDYFGRGCKQKCGCVNALRCDRRDGSCLCRSGWTGSKCEVACPAGLFGKNCNHHCMCQNDAPCDPTNGRCICPPGFIGVQCHLRCPAGSHGPDCSRTCSCANNGKCHHVDGKCDCVSGYYGEKCDNECPENMHGKGCTQKCDCVHAKSCDKKTGRCRCDIGWTGERCMDPCPNGHYGDYCLNKCQCEHNFLQHCHIELGCVCRFGHKHNDSTVVVSGVPLSDCATHSELADGPPIQNMHLVQERVSSVGRKDEAMPLFQQQVIFVLIFVLPLLVLCLVIFYRQMNENDGIGLSYVNANYDADSIPAVTMQPSQQAVRDQLPTYGNVFQSSLSFQSDTGIETDSRSSFRSTETPHIYDVPHSNLMKEVRPYACVPVGKSNDVQVSTSTL